MSEELEILQGLWIVIPAKDEEFRIHKILTQLISFGYKNIVVVDDGSTDNTGKVALNLGVTVLRHAVNLGPGGATFTGIKYACNQNAIYIATIDADNQHNPMDIEPMLELCIRSEADLIIGSRFLKKNDIPYSRRLYNWIANGISYFFSGMVVTDSQSGLKIFSRQFADQLVLQSTGFEFCIEIISQAKKHRAVVLEYPIDVYYSHDSMKKGQSLMNGVSMIARMFRPH